jgi:hypothetical protein
MLIPLVIKLGLHNQRTINPICENFFSDKLNYADLRQKSMLVLPVDACIEL